MTQRKGKKIRERTPEEQALYEELLPRLMAGESAADLSRITGVSRKNLNKWRYLARKKLRRSGANLTLVPERSAPVQAPVLAPVESVPILMPETQQAFALQQVAGANAWLVSMRGEKIQRGLCSIHENLQALLDGISGVLQRGTKTITAVFEGEITTQEISLTVADYRDGANAIKAVLASFSDLHMLPLKTQNVDAFADRSPIVQPHLHLHSHGGRDKEPSITTLIAEPVEPAIVTSLDPVNADILGEMSLDDLA
jgi:hypothetical protein